MTYSISGYGRMMIDHVRMVAYEQALRQAIKPGDLVLEIGTGTGIFALLAGKLGARQVIAIEPDDAIQVARQVAVTNGLSERIRFVQDFSTQVYLPEPADVIISDLRGVLPLFQQHISSLVDARTRLLAPHGILIPQRDTLWVAVVEAPELYKGFAEPWDTAHYGFDLQAGRQIVMNTWCKGRVKSEQLLTQPQSWATLDYTKIDSPNVQAQLTWEVERVGIAHGLSLWFDATLLDGITFSNAPGQPEAIYGQAFFPWTKPVSLTVGDVVATQLRADLVGDDYIWRWDTCVYAQGERDQVKANFKQSTFWGAPLALENLRKQRADYTPTLSEEGQIDRFILMQMGSQQSLSNIANQLQIEFPHRFCTWQDALTRAGEMSKKYS